MAEKEIPPVEKLFNTIIQRYPLPLPGLEQDFSEKAMSRARTIHHYLEERADRLYDQDCLMCGKMAVDSQTRRAYDTPWHDEPRTLHFCSDDCGDSYMYEEPFPYFWCDRCDREIAENNPRNRWHVQYREYQSHQICLRCYQDIIIESGVEREELEAGRIPGMFFSHGNTEAMDAGYQEMPDFTAFFIGSQETARKFRAKALELMDKGYRVVIGYESMAIGGSEGYVTLMVRR